MSQVLPRAAIIAIFLGSSAQGVAPGVASGFLESIHVVFLISACLILLALIPSLLRESGKKAGPRAPAEVDD